MKNKSGMMPGTEGKAVSSASVESEVGETDAGIQGPLPIWSTADRPVDKFRELGPMGLSDAELLSIVIGEGTKDRSAIELGRELLARSKNNLAELGRLSLRSIANLEGMGMDRAVQVGAALELGRRRQAGERMERPIVKDSAAVARYLQARFRDLTHEVFAVVFLNRANHIIHFEIVSSGGLTGTVADPRIILRKALEEEAVGLILCHNHPSGNLCPSPSDEALTWRLRDACRLLDIRLMDHVIVSSEGHYSFSDEGML